MFSEACRPHWTLLCHTLQHRYSKKTQQLGAPWIAAHHVQSSNSDEAVANGAHPSASTPEAATTLYNKTMDQIESGFARLIPWRLLREQLVKQLKVSPIAAIPHKSCSYRKIVDLSFALEGVDPVNEATDETTAPLRAMNELGWALPRIIHALATVPTNNGPILLAKFDLKDGYWRSRSARA